MKERLLKRPPKGSGAASEGRKIKRITLYEAADDYAKKISLKY